MKVDELGLVVGDGLQLQIGDETNQRFPVVFYGMNPRGSIIISAPSSGGDKMIFVREGQVVTVRSVINNVASGFTSRVISTRGQPYPHLHLEIPDDVQTTEVRKGIRVATNISVTAMNKTQKSHALAVSMIDMSCSGGRIEATSKIAIPNDKLSLTMTLKVEDIKCLVTMDCLIASVKEFKDGTLFRFGFNIKEIDDEDMVTVRAFIYQEILRNIHMI
jgi:hypothetical protein